MKKFLAKFILLFILIDGFLLFYIYNVYPKLSGDMGFLGQIPFGSEYMDSLQNVFLPDSVRVHDLQNVDSINHTIVTIGDSFSHCVEYGYSQAVAESFDLDITDIAVSDNGPGPIQIFVQYANNNRFPAYTIVIVESVERSLLARLSKLDMSDNSRPEIQSHSYVTLDRNAPKKKPDYLIGAIKYMRRLLNTKRSNSICRFMTDRNLFSHSTMVNQLFIYDSTWDEDGDLRYQGNVRHDYTQIYNKLYDLHKLAVEKQIHLIFLVAADKYDVYEPFIITKHKKNPTLDSIPTEEWIINSKPLLQQAIYSGTKDVYYINDSHWSPVGAKIVGDEISNRIRKLTYRVHSL